MKNKKKGRSFNLFLFAVILLLFIFSMGEFISNSENANFAGGSGTELDPYLIETKEHLNHVRHDLNAHYKMMNNIVFSQHDFEYGGWVPIGSQVAPFTGTFDGNGYVIENLYIDIESSLNLCVGLFGYQTGTIQNLGLKNSNIIVTNISPTSHTYIGSIVGCSYSGTVFNCYSNGMLSVSSLGKITGGGVVGWMLGIGSQVENCYFAGRLDATSPDLVQVGGIVGLVSEFSFGVTDCFNMGYVITDDSDHAYVGGIVGKCVTGTVRNVYHVGIVSGTVCGGIIGDFEGGTIENVYHLNSLVNAIGNGENIGTKCSWNQMKQKDTFVGFDFESVWYFDPSTEYPCPLLRKSNSLCWNFEGNTTEFAGGTGVPWDPFLIKNAVQLDRVRYHLDAHYKLLNNIVFSAEDFSENGMFYHSETGWNPIGSSAENGFSGLFDGNGYVIKNLYLNIHDSSTIYGGLFGYNTGVIQNLGLVNSNISMNVADVDHYVGGIVGWSSGEIINCYATGNFSGVSTGGIVGHLSSGMVSQCYNVGRVIGTREAGGIAGRLSAGEILDCYNSGVVSSSTGSIGAIVGTSFGEVRNCYYWELIPNGVGAGIDSSIKCTSSQMMQQATFTGFDFENVWTMEGHSDYFYPELRSVNLQFEKRVEFLEVIEKPTKLTYIEGEPFDSSGMVVVLQYNNGQTEPINDYNISGFSDTPGTKTLTVSKNEWCTNFSVTVKQKELVSIGVTTLPNKLVYVEGNPFDSAGIIVTAYYNNNTSEEISDYTLSGYTSTVGTKTITVSYQKVTTTFYVTVNQRSLTSIAITQLPANVSYLEGDSFKKTGMIVTAYYDNNTSKKVTEYDVSGYTSTPGVKTLTVTYQGKSATFSVTVHAKTLESIKVIKKPTKSTYVEGESFDPTGMIVKAYYNNDTSEEITNYAYSGYDSALGTKTITVTFDGKSAAFTVLVVEKSLSSIQVTTLPKKLIYLKGDAFDPSGMIVTALYNNGTSEIITDYTVRGFTSTPGIKEITVSYQRKTARFSVTVDSNVPSAITSNKHTVSNGNITKITVGTPINTLLANLNEGVFCKVYSGTTEVAKDKPVGTGMMIKIMDGTKVNASYLAIVTGDTNGDGSVSITDMISVKAHLLKKSTLSGAYATAADTNGDGTISITDFIQLKAQILKKGDLIAR